MSFTVDAQVKLKTGGPNMMVQAVDGNSVTCVWFDKQERRHVAKFRVETLEKPRDIGAILERRLAEAKTRTNES